MKAVYITKYGGSDQLVYGTLQRPEPKSGQVLVRVRAAAVNPRDWILRDGRYVFKFALPRFPIILGSDFSGDVVKCGPSASQFRIGDEVFGMQPLFGGMGAYAEYVAIDDTALAVGGGRNLHRYGGRILHTRTGWRLCEQSGSRRCTGGSNECCYVTIWSEV